MKEKMYDFLFELTEYSENEGEQILCEEPTLEKAWETLIENYGFEKRELRFLERMETWEGEMLGLDTY
jgi:hypothetical protein